MKETTGEKTFRVINGFLLVLISIVVLYPLIYILSASLSSSDAYMRGQVVLLPMDCTLDAYKKVLQEPNIWIAYGNTVYYTVVGTVINMVFTLLGAYPLSKRYLPGSKLITKLIVFTMWFNPGMIPLYMTFKEYGLLDSRTAIILGFAINTFNVILMKNFLEGVPAVLEDAAAIDGANDLQILWKIYLPLSMPAIATIALFYAVSRWNGYFWSMLIFSSDSKVPLQVLLKKLIVDITSKSEYANLDSSTKYSSETVIYATIVISIIPMMVVYPFIQKYFVKGVTVGAVKG